MSIYFSQVSKTYTPSVPNYTVFFLLFYFKFDFRLIQKIKQNISSYVVHDLLIKVLQILFKFDYICIFFNKTSGQTWGKKVKRIII
jgi:hypothetical protein